MTGEKYAAERENAKIQPADDCGKYAAEKGNEKNYDK